MADTEQALEEQATETPGAPHRAPGTDGAAGSGAVPAQAPEVEVAGDAGGGGDAEDHAKAARDDRKATGEDPRAGVAGVASDQRKAAVDAEDAEDADPDPDADGQALQGDVAELLATAAQRDEYLALAQRTQADFENYRKRVAREAALAQGRGVVKLAKELLPALDNLDRALESAAEQDPLLEGVRLVRSELGAALARVGVESFSPAGEPFDPVLHEAIVQQPVEGAQRGTVVEVYQPGYRLGANVIRPARVVVAA
jgi:molecular chaperone GrpE